jgi:hypothetical protein
MSFEKDFWAKTLEPLGLESPGRQEAVERTLEHIKQKKKKEEDERKEKSKKQKKK